jgi:hypothetical protein
VLKGLAPGDPGFLPYMQVISLFSASSSVLDLIKGRVLMSDSPVRWCMLYQERNAERKSTMAAVKTMAPNKIEAK